MGVLALSKRSAQVVPVGSASTVAVNKLISPANAVVISARVWLIRLVGSIFVILGDSD
jgi:hypothetical protein